MLFPDFKCLLSIDHLGHMVSLPPKYFGCDFSEWFFIDGGKIRDVYSAMFFPTGDVPVPNWPPYEGNFAPPSELAPRPAAQTKGK